MTRGRPQPPLRARILMGIVRTLAAAVIAIVASVALAGLDVRPIEFSRVLPIVLVAEVILYILMLGGGRIAGPVLLITLVAALILRAGLAVGAAALSPRAGGDLLADAQFYYASYWPAAIVQILVMLVLLRLLRPLIGRRPRRRRPIPTPKPEEIMDDATRDALLAALEQSPDAPPESPTVLEERQIGDLAEPPPAPAGTTPERQDLALPFEESASAVELEPVAAEKVGVEVSLPPGVIDATPEAIAARAATEQAAEAAAANEEPVAEETAAEQPVAAAAVAGQAPSWRSAIEAAEEVTMVGPPVTPAPAPAPGEDTAPLEPMVQAEPPAAAPAPGPAAPAPVPQDLRELMAVITEAAGGEGAELRVWATTHGATILAAVPSGTPATGTGARADALARVHAHLCSWLGAAGTATQLVATPLGAYVLRALDGSGHALLLLAERGPAAAAHLELTSARVVESARGLVADLPPPAPPAAPPLPAVRADLSLRDRIAATTEAVGGRIVAHWQGWRRADRRPLLVATPPGIEPESMARHVAALADAVEDLSDALALDGPSWLALADERVLLVLAWEPLGGEEVLLAAVSDRPDTLGRMRWELARVAAAAREVG